jgi:hypothetical protein
MKRHVEIINWKRLHQYSGPHSEKSLRHYCEDSYYLEYWLRMVVKPGIKEFTFSLNLKVTITSSHAHLWLLKELSGQVQ